MAESSMGIGYVRVFSFFLSFSPLFLSPISPPPFFFGGGGGRGGGGGGGGGLFCCWQGEGGLRLGWVEVGVEGIEWGGGGSC